MKSKAWDWSVRPHKAEAKTLRLHRIIRKLNDSAALSNGLLRTIAASVYFPYHDRPSG